MNSVTSTRRADGSGADDIDGSAPKPVPGGGPDLAARAEAQARHDAIAAGLGPYCREEHEPDLCGTVSIKNAVAFVQQEKDPDPVSRLDITQTTLSDCHFMAPLAAIASSPEGRALIKNAIVENKNEKGDVVSYTVTLHRGDDPPWGPRTFSEIKFTIDGRFGQKHALERRSGGVAEVWPLILEKAFAQLSGGYSRIDGKGTPVRALEALTGRPAMDIRLDQRPGYGAPQLQRDLEAGKPVVLLSKDSMPGNAPRGIVGNHAYQVDHVELEGGRLWVALHNPWNQDARQPTKVPFDQLKRWFQAVDVGSVK